MKTKEKNSQDIIDKESKETMLENDPGRPITEIEIEPEQTSFDLHSSYLSETKYQEKVITQ